MTQEQETKLKEVAARVKDWEIHLIAYSASVREGSFSRDLVFLYDILLQTIAERDEARQIAKEYRDSDGVESWYRDSTTDPLPWEAKDV